MIDEPEKSLDLMNIAAEKAYNQLNKVREHFLSQRSEEAALLTNAFMDEFMSILGKMAGDVHFIINEPEDEETKYIENRIISGEYWDDIVRDFVEGVTGVYEYAKHEYSKLKEVV